MTTMKLAGRAAAVLAVLLAGCGGGPEKMEATSGGYREITSPIELIAKGRPTIPDLPVPIGFELDTRRSRHFATAAARWVDHLYKGNANIFAVSRFYKRQMPTQRWTFVTDRFGQGDIILDFEKETERCQVTISKGSLFHSAYIKAQVWTTGRIISPEEKTGGSTGKR